MIKKDEKKNILMITNADAIWAKRFVESVSNRINFQTTIFSSFNSNYKDFYKENGIEVISPNIFGISIGNQFIRYAFIAVILPFLLKSKKFDTIQLNYVNPNVLKLISRMHLKKRIICNFWGSDLLRASPSSLLKHRNVIDAASDVIVVTQDSKKYFEQLFYSSHGTNHNQKLHVINMGLSSETISFIDIKRKDRDSIKKRYLGTSHNKITVAVGYSAIKEQQHIKVLEQLAHLSKNDKNNIVIILPLTYPKPADTSYINSIKKVLDNIDIEYLGFHEFLSDEKMAELCLISDVFINAQTTDAFAGTIRELLYSGTYVINGSWLNYSYLKDNKIYCESFNDFPEIKEIIHRIVLEGISISPKKLTCIKEDFCNENIYKTWDKIYREG